jgi:membrane-associated phospholipid phosphatase
VWFAFPHGTVAYVLLRHRERFPRAAAQVYATFDVGVIGYWLIPTAPPWYAAARGHMEDGRTPELRRMMTEYGEQFWKSGWAPLYGVLGGNPLAAMPSLHFATSVTAAHVLSDTGKVAGLLGWTYAATLGLALVYLGEHYVADLAAGLVLAEGVRRATPAVAPLARRLSRAAQSLEARARA